MIPIVLYLLINMFIGGITCFYGKKLYFPILMLNVFSAVVTLSFSIFDLNFMVITLTIVVATLSAILAYYFYKVGVFLIGGLLGGSLSLFIVSFLPMFMMNYSWMIFVVLIVVFGICAVKWCDFFIIVSTSFNGAFTISTLAYFLILNMSHLHNFIYIDGIAPTISNLNNYINNEFIMQNSLLLFILTIIISLFAIIYQSHNFIKDECR